MSNIIFKFIQDTCSHYSDNILFDNAITYKDAFQLIKSRAAFLQKCGIKKGEPVGLVAMNSAEWCITHMAIVAAGGIVLALDTNLSPDLHYAMLHRVDVRYVFVSPEFQKDYKEITVLNISLKENIESPETYKEPVFVESDLSALLYTSGTTGDPKIVSLTQRNLVKTSIATVEHLNIVPDDTIIAILPLYHIYGLIANVYGPFAAGSSIVFQPSLKGSDIIETLKNNRITVFPAVPQLWELFFDGIENKVKAQSSLKHSIFMFMAKNGHILKKIGLGFIVKAIFKPIHQTFGVDMKLFASAAAALKTHYHKYYTNMGFTILEAYGLSETTGPVCITKRDNKKPGIVGIPVAGSEIKLKNVNEDNIGEIWIRGEGVMPGYYKNPKVNAEVFDSEGWYDSGDLGFVDKDGDLHITGRKKNVIVLESGKNVYPEEIEEYYQKSDKIKEIAVFGKTINNKETVYSVIVPTVISPTAYQEIDTEVRRMSEGLPTYRTIKAFALSFDPLPRTTTKKVIIREIEKNLAEGRYQESEQDDTLAKKELTGNSEQEQHIIDVLKKILKTKVLHLNESLEDFGLDSLQKISFIVQLEQELGIQIDAIQLSRVHEITALVEYLSSCKKTEGKTLHDNIFTGTMTTHTGRLYHPMARLFLYFCNNLSKFFWKLKVKNSENLRIDNTILVANHQSYLDILWILGSIPYKQRKDVYIIGKKELSFLGFLFPGIRVIFVDRGADVYPALKAGADILRKGKSLFVFPEGTRTRNGKLGEFKSGSMLLSYKLKKKIIPITVKGAYNIYPPDKKLPALFTKQQGTIIVHPPLSPGDYGSVDALTKAAQETISKSLES